MESSLAEQTTPFEKGIALSTNFDRVDADMDRLDEQINSMIATTDRSDPKSGKLFACKVCGKEGARAHVAPHIEAKHLAGVSHTCDLCGKTARSRDGLRKHNKNFHTNTAESA